MISQPKALGSDPSLLVFPDVSDLNVDRGSSDYLYMTSLVRRVLATRPLVNALGGPVNLIPSASHLNSLTRKTGQACASDTKSILDRVTARLGMHRFLVNFDIATKITSFEQAISNKLAMSANDLYSIPVPTLGELDEVIDAAVAQSLPKLFRRETIASFDGMSVNVYSGGDRHAPVVVLATACGMPAELSERWLHDLARDYFVVTWESRGLFGDVSDFDSSGSDVGVQARDLVTVMDHFGLQSAHVMGFCGGAVIALAAAATYPSRISSLSLWHGDYELGNDCAKTDHQKDVKSLMMMAGSHRAQANALHAMFRRPSILASIRGDMAHFVLYPYSTSELLYRYGKMNGHIMDADVQGMLNNVYQPALVVTSDGDTTAHPDGTRYVAAKLRNARLHVEPRGDHLSLFDARTEMVSLAKGFIN